MRNSCFNVRRTKRHLRTENLEPRMLLAGDILITELMALNDATLVDEDRNSSDWIELYNNSYAPIDLGGWYLTDDREELTKWQFPAVNVQPGDYLLVFASGKDRAGDGSELHTNFKLSSEGEYLAVVEPDGATVSHEFDPFPEQFTDVSYGTDQTTLVTTLLPAGSAAMLLLPTTPAEDVATSQWSAPGFDDSAWLERNTGVGFGPDGPFDGVIDAGGGIAQMRFGSASAYVRTTFEIDGPVPNFDQLQLDINYDDGFAAYLNGIEIGSRNAPPSLAWDAVATAERGVVVTSQEFDDFKSSEVQRLFTLNGDAFWDAGELWLTSASASQSAAAWMTEAIGFGADYSFSTSMAIDVTAAGGLSDTDGPGGHGMTFVLQSGGQFRLGASGGALGLDQTGMQFVAVEFDSWSEGSFDDDDDVLPSHIGIDTSVDGNLAREAVPRFNGSSGTSPRYVWIDYDGHADVIEVFFASSDTKPASPTLSTSLDLEAIFEGVPSLWAGWTAATGEEAWNSHKVLNWEITSFGHEPGLVAETIDVSEFAGQLRTGENVLAIHGLNITAEDEDFLIRPTLIATQDHVVSLDERSYFSEPTPGTANSRGVQPPAGSVSFSVTGRTFVEPFVLEMSPPSPTATVRYTIDGSVPDENSPEYTRPVRIRASARIRSRAFEPGRAPGPVISHSYIALGSSLTDFEGGVFESNLPLMVFDSFGGNVHANARNLVPVWGVFIDTADGRAHLLDEPDFAGRAGLRIRGQSSQGWPKKQYALEIWGEGHSDTAPISAARADDRSVSFFGLPAESDWVLNGPYSDKTQLNNYLTFLWSNRIGQYAPRARLVEVFVNTNGGRLDYRTDYRGTYVLLEKIKVDAARVDIAELTPADLNEPEVSGGYIWKYDKDGAGDVNFSTTFQSRAGGQPWKFVEPQRPQREQRNWLRDHLIEFENVLYGRNFADPDAGYAKYIDVDSWIDTWLLVELTKNIDGFRLSTYYYKDRDGKIRQGPAWDYNLSLANANYLQGAFPEGWYHDLLSPGQYPYWDRLFRDPNFVTRLHDRWFELRQTVFSTENLLADIDEAVATLTSGSLSYEVPAAGEPSNPISRNFDRWGTINTYLWPNCFFGTGSCPASPLPGRGRPDSYEDYIFIMKDFLQRRTEWIDGQFGIPPTISPSGGMVDEGTEITITSSTSGTIYYTLDGTEPQHDRRNRPDNVFQYSGPITIRENSIVTARLLRGARNWSGKASVSYFVTVPSIVISELHYNPAAPSAAEKTLGFTDNDDFEFVELLNFGSEPVDLAGIQFVEGVEFAFRDGVLGPGERGILARNKAALIQRYGNAVKIVGQYGNRQDPNRDFKLSNSGERVAITGPLDVPIMDFTYSDGWHPLTDGDDFSLVIRHDAAAPAAAWSDASAWRPSDFTDGSPGSADTGFAPLPNSIVINEVVSNSSIAGGDIVELYNSTDTAVPIGNFYFSDDAKKITKFKIPPGATVPARGYLLLDSTLMGPGFAVSDLGGTLTLQAADSFGAFAGFRASEAFGTADVDRAIGRHQTSAGLVDFTALTTPTLGAKNAPPRIGPVVINELHYHPESGRSEFLELHNISAQDIDLGDGWAIAEGIDYQFPAGATILAGGYVLLIQGADNGDPTGEIRDFRAEFQISEEVGIHVYTRARNGGFNNGGEAVALARPDASKQLRVVVDRVDYNDQAPWPPRADGQGPSLSRIVPDNYGNDPGNWKGGIPGGTPGLANLLEDATPPTTPVNLVARLQEDGRVALGWAPALDTDGEVDHYGIYRNGRLIGTSPITRYVDDVQVGTAASLTYEVSAFNRDGFESGRSEIYDLGLRTVSFQQGTDRYSGTSDAEIIQSEPDSNNGQDRRLEVDGDDPTGTSQDVSALIRWDDLSLPADSTVVGATIILNVANPGDDYEFKRINTAWTESEVTWNEAASGRLWHGAGARGARDVGETVARLSSPTREIIVTTFNNSGIRMVQDWIDNPSTNHGVIIVDPGSSADNIFFDSSEASNRSNRPKLTIAYVGLTSPRVGGDFNLDDVVDGNDIDLIYAALAADVSDPVFDLDRDGSVNQDDIDELVEAVLGTRYGDANLDGTVQFDDFLALASNFGSMDMDQTWNEGDFDGDGKAQFSDFLQLAANFGHPT